MTKDVNDMLGENREIIIQFIQEGKDNPNDLNDSVTATIVEFLAQFGKHLMKYQKDYVAVHEIIDAQIHALRKCVIDLCAYKERLTEGVTLQ